MTLSVKATDAPGVALRTARMLAYFAVLIVALSLRAQTSQNGTTAPPASTQANERSTDTDINPFTHSAHTALSAEQIITILQDRPQITIELKSLLAQMQPPGSEIQADNVTDEMLYSQITASKEVRQNITVFLRARGYISDADLQRDSQNDFDAMDSDSSYPQQSQLRGSHLARGSSASLTPNESASEGAMTPGDPAAAYESLPTRDDASGRNQKDHAKPEYNITDEPQTLRQPTPYNLMSLRDLYSQIPDTAEHLKRFGSDVFLTRNRASIGQPGNTVREKSLDVPIGPDYILGPGDGITIDLWGGISQSLSRVIAVDGHITLPEAGDIQLAGLTLERAQAAIQNALKRQFRDVKIAISLSRLRTIRIYVVGDVQRPGAYDVNSLSSPLNVLYAAGGPTAVGSLRMLEHYRNKQLVGKIDLYDFLLHGVRDPEDRLQAGDTLIVPAVGPQVAVWGAVRRPAIYELKDEFSLAKLLNNAGGMTVAASLGHISIERIDPHQHRETTNIALAPSSDPAKANATIAAFEVKDGDRIHIDQIAPNSEHVIYLEGHVARPGRHPYREGMHLSDVLQSYQDLLPEPASHGEIIRLVPPDLHAQTIDFDVPEALIGNTNPSLQPFDTIRILGRYEVDAPKTEVRGEVLRPGSYPLSEGMTAAQLVRMAGGFKRDALLERADLMSYRVVNGTKVEGQRSDIRIGDAVQKADSKADAELKPGDVLTIHQISGWDDIGASITIEGEVSHPGSYGFQDGEHLSDMLRRAGGFRETAYSAGAVLVRDQVRDLEEKSRVELIRQIETSSAAARLSSNIGTADQSGQMLLIQQQQEQILSRLRSQPATGRLVIHITSDISAWAGTAADIEVRQGDVLRIPKKPGFVLVSGQVYNASAITYAPGKTAGWYLQHAGGATGVANRREIFVIRANGSVVGRRSGEWCSHDVLSTHLQPGDVVVVPQKIIGASLFWRNLLSAAQIASSIAITTALAGL